MGRINGRRPHLPIRKGWSSWLSESFRVSCPLFANPHGYMFALFGVQCGRLSSTPFCQSCWSSARLQPSSRFGWRPQLLRFQNNRCIPLRVACLCSLKLTLCQSPLGKEVLYCTIVVPSILGIHLANLCHGRRPGTIPKPCAGPSNS